MGLHRDPSGGRRGRGEIEEMVVQHEARRQRLGKRLHRAAGAASIPKRPLGAHGVVQREVSYLLCSAGVRIYTLVSPEAEGPGRRQHEEFVRHGVASCRRDNPEDQNEVTILSRELKWEPDLVRIEADPPVRGEDHGRNALAAGLDRLGGAVRARASAGWMN